MKKRFEIRRSVKIPIEVITSMWDEPINFRTGDLTPQGAYVVSEFMPAIGEKIVCSFSLSDMLCRIKEYCFFGEVTRVNLLRRSTDKGRPGFGVRFLDAAPLDRLRIRSILFGLPPPLSSPRKEVSLKECFGKI
jgi:hypothetical protein